MNALLLSLLFLNPVPPTRFDSPTRCTGNHGVWRWAAKVDEENPPHFIDRSHTLTPSDIAGWAEPKGKFIKSTPRGGREKEFYELTGRVQLIMAEEDGDLHIQLEDLAKPGVSVVVEVPMGEPWDEIRTTVFHWTMQTFPFNSSGAKVLSLASQPVITVEGKAFWDGFHKGPIPNRRSYDKNLTVWEIHPVMTLKVKN